MKKYQRIEDLRIDRDLTQEQMSKLMNTSKTQYQRYENSTGNNFFEAMISIAKIHNVSLDYIAGLTNDKGGLHKNDSILRLYNRLDEADKNIILRIIERLAKV